MTRRPMTAIAAIVPVFLLAACSGGGGSQDAGPPVNRVGPDSARLGTPYDGFDAIYDEDTDTVVLRNQGNTQVLARSATLSNGRMGAYTASPQPIVAMVGRTPSGGGEARVLVDPTQNVATSGVSRFGQSEVPLSGRATYLGDYAGLVVFDSTGAPFESIAGDVELSVHFGRGEVGGAITNRVGTNAPTKTFEDVAIVGGTISNGAFEAATTGGALNILGAGSTTGTGNAKGLFVGRNGGEVVGAVRVPHDRSGTGYTEFGAFVAD